MRENFKRALKGIALKFIKLTGFIIALRNLKRCKSYVNAQKEFYLVAEVTSFL